jgi:HEPN domain-containing protein
MKQITAEWVQKAEGDFGTAEREISAQLNPNYDAVCFHSQQCAEKYLKARLQEAGIRFGRTHDLSPLLDLAIPLEPAWESFRDGLDTLTTFAVDYRYPGELAGLAEAQRAIEICRLVRRAIRDSLGLES